MSESLHPEINLFPVWTFESRILQHEWANTNIALIFSYLLARYKFHHKGGRQLYESYEVIAKATGVCVRTAKSAIKTLADNFHLTITKKRTPSSYVNVYVVNDIYKTWEVKKQQSSSSNSTQTAKKNSYDPATGNRRLSFAEEIDIDIKNEERQRARKELEEADTPF